MAGCANARDWCGETMSIGAKTPTRRFVSRRRHSLRLQLRHSPLRMWRQINARPLSAGRHVRKRIEERKRTYCFLKSVVAARTRAQEAGAMERRGARRDHHHAPRRRGAEWMMTAYLALPDHRRGDRPARGLFSPTRVGDMDAWKDGRGEDRLHRGG